MNRLIEFEEIKNFWIVYLMPFGNEDRNNPFVKEYQEFCKDKGIFGMGWNDEESIKEFEKVPLNERVYKKDQSKIKTFKTYRNIDINDLVMMRLKNGKYYIGKVKEKAKRSKGEDIQENNNELNTGRISYFCEVDKWYEYSEFELPGDIVGRFSQRRHSTIQRIGGDEHVRIKRFMYSLYKQKFSEENNIENVEIPKIELHKKDFTEALNYMDLEDLVYMYILEQYKKDNRKWLLFPSECKISKTRYEFDLIDKDNPNKRITCQVKNKEEVDYKEYLNDASSDEYEKIFLFSGIGVYGKNINEGKAIEQIKNKNLIEKLEIIGKSELYDFFMDNEIMWKREKIYKFYQKTK